MNKSVLIIEDDQSIADLEKDFLEIEGFEVKIASDGEQGLKMANSGRFDLIILDIMLPGMDGFQLCKKIRLETDIPILMVTAKFDDHDKVRGFGLGANDYIVKPFSPTELVARVKAHLANYERLIHKDKEKREIVVSGLHIDLLARKVFVNEQEKDMTNKEFDLLAFLAMNPNQVFSKEQLFERIWGLDAMGDNATVTVHVKRIRKKIERDPANYQFIQTVWGTGYRFNA